METSLNESMSQNLSNPKKRKYEEHDDIPKDKKTKIPETYKGEKNRNIKNVKMTLLLKVYNTLL